MAKKICLFNHKGGVSKATTTFNLGWMLAEKGKRVIMADTDPQCNLTGMVLDFLGKGNFEEFYRNQPNNNIKSGLSPAFDMQPKPMDAVDCLPVQGREGLFLLPGHIGIAEYEVSLGMAQELGGNLMVLKNLPGSIHYLLEKTAQKLNADYILIDTGSGLSAFNQNLLMTSDFFIIPNYPDYFSVMAIDSLSTVLPKWKKWSERAGSKEILQNASYPFPQISPKFLGIIIQNFASRNGSPVLDQEEWSKKIKLFLLQRLIPAIKGYDFLIPDEIYNKFGLSDYCLSEIPDFNNQNELKSSFSNLADTITGLIDSYEGRIQEI